MEKTPSASSGIPKSGKLWRILLFLAPLLIVISIAIRPVVQQVDESVANIVTLILGFLAWLCLTSGLAWSPWPRYMWRSTALLPIVLIAGFLALYRVVRLDGALLPQFESRWKVAQGLPKETGSSEVVPFIEAALLQPSPNDFPQFLGPTRDGKVTAVKLNTNWEKHPPKLLWRQPIGNGWSGFAVRGQVAFTLEQRDREQWVSAYETSSGKLFWHAAFPGSHFNALGGAGPRATPTVAENFVYIQTATGQLACLEASKGEVVWQRKLLELAGWDKDTSEADITWGRAGSPLIVDDLVVVPLGGPGNLPDRSLIAFNKADGEIAWRVGNDQISYSSPSLVTLLGIRQIVIVNENSVTGHEVATGKILWRTPWDGQSNGAANVSQTVAISDNQLLISKGYSQGAKLIELKQNEAGQITAEDIWQKTSVLKTKFTSAVTLGDYAYGLSDGTLECVRVADGKRQWKGGRYGHGQLILVHNVLLITAEYGQVVLVAAHPEGYEQLAKMEVFDAITWNVPALSGNKLLIRNADEAACFELPLASDEPPTAE